jgi:predicted RNA-binding Zn ribbon-like protein
MTVSSPALPHGLGLVVDFVNTRQLEQETDDLATPEALAQWLAQRGLLDGGVSLSAAEVEQASELREAIRRILLEHNGGRTGGAGAGLLDRVAERGRLSVRFGDDGAVHLDSRATGFPAALARLVVPIADAARDGAWERVKACADDDCQWAFFDRSRNRSGRWCDMAVCGNRTKVRAYRTKNRA